MRTENFILVNHYCEQTRIPVDFIYSLQDYGFIEVREIEDKIYVEPHAIVEIERVSRLQNDLEGIDALFHMLQKVEQLESQLRYLKERLKIYEP